MAEQHRFSADELVLMLDFVLERKAGGKRTVPELSAQLRALPSNRHLSEDEAFRSVLGLRTSLGYMRAIDEAEGDWPPPDESGHTPNWRPHFKEVWRAFGRDPEALKVRVAAILEQPEAAEEVEEPDIDEGFVEGRTYYALHRRRERSQAAIQRKKSSPAVCEVCGFDFSERYGEHGAGYIECHHVEPLAESGETITYRDDLVLVCANCHRMLHRGAPAPTVEALRSMLIAST